MKRAKRTFVICLLALTCILPSMVASAKTTKSEQAFKKYMKYYKSFYMKKANNLMEPSKGKTDIIIYAKSKDLFYKYVKKCAKNLTYSVLSVSQKKNTSKIKVRFRCIDSKNVVEYMFSLMMADAMFGVDIDSMSEKQFCKYISTACNIADSKCKDIYKTKTLTINMVKVKGKWKVKMTKDFSDLLTGYIFHEINKYE